MEAKSLLVQWQKCCVWDKCPVPITTWHRLWGVMNKFNWDSWTLESSWTSETLLNKIMIQTNCLLLWLAFLRRRNLSVLSMVKNDCVRNKSTALIKNLSVIWVERNRFYWNRNHNKISKYLEIKISAPLLWTILSEKSAFCWNRDLFIEKIVVWLSRKHQVVFFLLPANIESLDVCFNAMFPVNCITQFKLDVRQAR